MLNSLLSIFSADRVFPPPRDRLQRWGLPLLSGLFLGLAFPGHPGPILSRLFGGGWALIALLPLLLSLPGGRFKTGFRRGWITGSVASLISLYWVAGTQGGGPAVVGGAFLMAAYLGLFSGVCAGCQNQLFRRWGPIAVLGAPLLWTAQEYLLSLGELGFPWLLLGHSQAAFPALIQYAAFTGAYGVSFWVVLQNALLYLLLAAPLPPRRRLLVGGLLVVGFLAPYLHGRAVMATSTPAPTVRVALIQTNLGLEKWQANGLQRSFVALETLSRQAATQHPDLLVWPETAVPCYVRQNPSCQGRIESLVKELQVPVLTGAPDYNHSTQATFNAAFYYRPNLTRVQSYAKMHLVPFGERTPFRDSIPLLRDIDWAALTGDLGSAEFTPGTSRTLFAHPQAPFAVLICFESVFPDLVRRNVAAGARLLVNITNDSWFGPTAGPRQHLQLAILRAVENRTAIARCATSGISVFIDPFGRTFAATDLFVPDVRVEDLPVGQGGTFYTRYGDLFARLSLLGAVLCMAIAARSSHRRKTN